MVFFTIYYNFIEKSVPKVHLFNISEIDNILTALLLIIIIIFFSHIFFYTLRRFVRPFFTRVYLLIPNKGKFVFKFIYSIFDIFLKSKLFYLLIKFTILIIFIIMGIGTVENAPPMITDPVNPSSEVPGQVTSPPVIAVGHPPACSCRDGFTSINQELYHNYIQANPKRNEPITLFSEMRHSGTTAQHVIITNMGGLGFEGLESGPGIKMYVNEAAPGQPIKLRRIS